jgi:acyl carrier protein
VIDEIRHWLVRQVAHHLGMSTSDIDPAVPLAEFGVDSLAALRLCGDIEDEWAVEADPTLVYDYPTINDIVGYLLDERRAA